MDGHGVQLGKTERGFHTPAATRNRVQQPGDLLITIVQFPSRGETYSPTMLQTHNLRGNLFNMQIVKTAVLTITLSFSLYSSPPENETNAIHYWAFDRSDPALVRCGDVWAASRVETANETIRLLTEVDGKLTVYWESRDKTCWKTVKQALLWSPSMFVPAAEGAFVQGKAIRSFEYRKDGDGKETYTLKGFTAELGSVSDAEAIKALENHLKALRH